MLKFLNPAIRKLSKKNKDHNAVIAAIVNELTNLEDDVAKVRLELVINTSTGMWLDNWGSWFGISRLPGEADSSYAGRLVSMVSTANVTIPALRDAVRRFYDDNNLNVEIYEPYNNIKRFNISEFSGTDAFQSDDYYRSGVVDIKIPNKFIDPSLIAGIQDIKAAGIRVLFTNLANLLGEEGVVQFHSGNEPSLLVRTIHSLKLLSEADKIFSGREAGGNFSGRQVLFEMYSNEYALPLIVDSTEDGPIKSFRNSILYNSRSGTAFHSGYEGAYLYAAGRSGYKLTEIDHTNPIPWEPTPLYLKSSNLLSLGSYKNIKAEHDVNLPVSKVVMDPFTPASEVKYPPELRGGRNLIPRSTDLSSMRWIDYGGATKTFTNLPDGYVRLKTSGGTGLIKTMLMVDFLKNNYSNQEVTLSLEIINDGKNVVLGHNWVGGKTEVIPSGFSGTYLYTGAISTTSAGQIQFRAVSVEDSVNIRVRQMKVEVGTRATPWTPAPEDLGLTYPDWVQEFGQDGITVEAHNEVSIQRQTLPKKGLANSFDTPLGEIFEKTVDEFDNSLAIYLDDFSTTTTKQLESLGETEFKAFDWKETENQSTIFGEFVGNVLSPESHRDTSLRVSQIQRVTGESLIILNDVFDMKVDDLAEMVVESSYVGDFGVTVSPA